MISPELQLFNEIFSKSQAMGYATYDYLPDASAPYPFVHVDESDSDDIINNKDDILGDILQTVHVWGYADDRATFKSIEWDIKQMLRDLYSLKNYYVRLQSLNSTVNIDRTTNDSLLHGVIEVGYIIF